MIQFVGQIITHSLFGSYNLGDYDGSENEYSINDTADGPDASNSKPFGRRHWDRSDPKTVVKQEKV